MTVVAFVYILDRACRDPEPLARFMATFSKGAVQIDTMLARRL
jgi:hypothetical protein